MKEDKLITITKKALEEISGRLNNCYTNKRILSKEQYESSYDTTALLQSVKQRLAQEMVAYVLKHESLFTTWSQDGDVHTKLELLVVSQETRAFLICLLNEILDDDYVA